jgi:hypothetical protein
LVRVKEMRGEPSDKQPEFPAGIEKYSGPLGMVTIPLLHSFSGSAGAGDEILIALVGGLVLVLVLSLVFVGNKGERQGKDEQPDKEGL